MAYDNKRRGTRKYNNDRPAPVFTELMKFDMWADCPGSQKRARLTWGTMDGNPRVSVFLNHPDYEGGAGILAAGFYVEHFTQTIQMLIDIMRSGVRGKGLGVDIMADIYDDNGKSIGKEKKCTFFAGIDKDGMAYQTVWQDGKPRAVFRFIGSPNFSIRVRDPKSDEGDEGRLLSVDSNREEYSQTCAIGYFSNLIQGMTASMTANKPPRQPAGGDAQSGNTQATQADKSSKKDDFGDVEF